MLLRNWLTLTGLFSVVAAHGTEEETSDDDILDMKYSLPDLSTVNTIPSEWKSSGSVKLEEGRIRLTPEASSKGSIWNNNAYQVKNSFSFEWTFRSVDFLGKSQGGIAFWLVDGKHIGDTSLFGGPSTFDGLQILVDSNGPLGSSIRGVLNDGSAKITEENIYDNSFASCLLAYQDTTVPTTLRLVYNREDDNLLKLQVDNRVCFQTRKVQLPANAKYRLGVTASNDNNKESLELLKMHIHNGITKGALVPNINPMEQPRLVTKTINKETGKEELVETDFMKVKGMAKEIGNYEIYKKLDKIEGKVLANDINGIDAKLSKLVQLQNDNSKRIEHLATSLELIMSSMGKEGDVNTESFKEFFAMNDKLEKLLQDQAKIRETTKQSMENANNGLSVDEIVKRILIWILPLIGIVLVMAYYIFRIRQDIVKVKLL